MSPEAILTVRANGIPERQNGNKMVSVIYQKQEPGNGGCPGSGGTIETFGSGWQLLFCQSVPPSIMLRGHVCAEKWEIKEQFLDVLDGFLLLDAQQFPC